MVFSESIIFFLFVLAVEFVHQQCFVQNLKQGIFRYVGKASEHHTRYLFAATRIEQSLLVGQFGAVREAEFNAAVFGWRQVTNPGVSVIKRYVVSQAPFNAWQ